mmetsp:Transcript_113013/g.314511  ORF Transcript_113013/g.314511 Transcript_113013/m.314511 type:complete len:259 (+) Transcript_113013:1186-1962(+)
MARQLGVCWIRIELECPPAFVLQPERLGHVLDPAVALRAPRERVADPPPGPDLRRREVDEGKGARPSTLAQLQRMWSVSEDGPGRWEVPRLHDAEAGQETQQSPELAAGPAPPDATEPREHRCRQARLPRQWQRIHHANRRQRIHHRRAASGQREIIEPVGLLPFRAASDCTGTAPTCHEGHRKRTTACDVTVWQYSLHLQSALLSTLGCPTCSWQRQQEADGTSCHGCRASISRVLLGPDAFCGDPLLSSTACSMRR